MPIKRGLLLLLDGGDLSLPRAAGWISELCDVEPEAADLPA